MTRAYRAAVLWVFVAALAWAQPVAAQAATPKVPPNASKPGWVGVVFGDVPPMSPGTPPPPGIFVKGVIPGSPAEKSGLVAGDVIVEMNGLPAPPPAAFARMLPTLAVGKTLALSVSRPGMEEMLSITIVVEAKDLAAMTDRAVAKGAAWLAAHQMESGAWPSFLTAEAEPHVGTTALVLTVLARLPDAERKRNEAQIAKAIAYLKGHIGEDGAVRQPNEVVAYVNYSTALFSKALALLDADRYKETIDRARAFLVKRQVAEEFGVSDLHWQYGAWDYYDENDEATRRADISITSYVLEGLRAGGLEADHPAWGRARAYLGRCQNWEANPPEFLKAVRDGGFFFTPRESKAGMGTTSGPDKKDRLADQVVFRSYGSATADGLRAMLYAGTPLDSPRVQAALRWIAANYDVSRNPGFGEGMPVQFDRGIFYYYLRSLAEALDTAGVTQVPGPDGQGRAWAEDIADRVLLRQDGTGAWQNAVNVMNEDNPVIATAFAVWTLETVRPRLP